MEDAASAPPPPDYSTIISGASAKDVGLFILAEKAEGALKSLDFLKAAEILERMLSMQTENKLRTQLQLADCYLQLGRERRADDVIKDIQQNLITSPFKAHVILDLSTTNLASSHYIRAYILLQCTAELYKRESPEQALAGIRRCVWILKNIAKKMAETGGRMKVIAADFVLPTMQEMLDAIRTIKIPDVDLKIVSEANCIYWMGCSYFAMARHDKELPLYEQGIQLLERHFGSKVDKYYIYSSLLNNSGVASRKIGNVSEAEKFYTKSLKAADSAEDWPSEKFKQENMSQTKASLSFLQSQKK